jgi:alkylation response protein AidB-like acyl-CoA dehydrogenase
MGEMTDVAMKLRDEFDGRAADADLTGTIQKKNFEQMAESGYLRGPVPTELGGLGAGLVENATAQRALGWGCGSTALTVNMHLFQVGAAAEAYGVSGANEAPLRKVANDWIVLGSTAAEAVVAGEWDTPTTATQDGDGYVINGRKFFFSGSHVTDMVRVNAMDTDTGEILVVAIPMHSPGVSIVDTWDTMGMRATASNDLILEDVRVPNSAIGVRLPADGPVWDPAFAAVVRWFISGITGVYLGIADRAREAAYDAIGSGSNSLHRAQSLSEAMIGELEIAHFSASSAFECGVRRIAEITDPIEGLAVAIAMKEASTTASVAVVDRASQIVGGRSFHRRSILERLARDVRAARFHPPSAPVAQQMIGIAQRKLS